MIDEDQPDSGPSSEVPGQPWWAGGGMPDLASVLGPEGMQAVGGVAEEALKVFVVLREKVGPALSEQAAELPGPPGGWGPVMSQLAAGAVRAVTEFAASGPTAAQPAAGGAPAEGAPHPAGHIAPGEAAACSYCPLCQVISLVRLVPMGTWQKLAASVVEAADSVPDGGGAAPASGSVRPSGTSQAPVEAFLAGLAGPTDGSRG